MKNPKAKRIIALSVVILLVCLYLSTLVFALIDSPFSHELLMISVMATIVLPVLMYGFTIFIKVTNDEPDDEKQDEKDHKK